VLVGVEHPAVQKTVAVVRACVGERRSGWLAQLVMHLNTSFRSEDRSEENGTNR
jgi:hypothetical protein